MTKVNIAGKDTTVGDEMGDDSEKPQAAKKTTEQTLKNKQTSPVKKNLILKKILWVMNQNQTLHKIVKKTH